MGSVALGHHQAFNQVNSVLEHYCQCQSTSKTDSCFCQWVTTFLILYFTLNVICLFQKSKFCALPYSVDISK